MKNHNWTPDTMDECRRVFMDDLVYYYLSLKDSEFRKEKLEGLIKLYADIETDVSKMVVPKPTPDTHAKVIRDAAKVLEEKVKAAEEDGMCVILSLSDLTNNTISKVIISKSY